MWTPDQITRLKAFTHLLERPGLLARSWTPQDASLGFQLSTEAGWNQTASDWHFLLDTGRGLGITEAGNLQVASILLFPVSDRLSWISMVLVTEKWRRYGLATALMQTCLSLLREEGLPAGLEATVFGRPVYEKLGFQAGFRTRRWRRAACSPRAVPDSVPVANGGAVVRLRTTDIVLLRTTLGDDPRLPSEDLLHHLHQQSPEASWAIRDGNGRTMGILCSRPGRTARHLGPILATEANAARALFQHATNSLDEALLADLPVIPLWEDEAAPAPGFAVEREFLRMTWPETSLAERPDPVYALAGPELG